MPASSLYLLPVLATLFWGANFNLSKHVLADMDALTAAAGRFDIAAAVMWVICLARRESVPLLRYGLTYGALGLIGIGLFNVLFFVGMQSTSAVNGALIMAMNPLVTALIAVAFTRARLRPRQMLALPIALAGVAFVVLGGGAGLQVRHGDLLMIGGSLCWGFYNVLVGERLPRDVSGLANTAALMTAGAVVLTAAAWTAGVRLHPVHTDAAGALLLMSLCGSVLAYLFWNAGITRIGAARAALFMNLVPVSSMIIATFEGQTPTWVQMVGGAVVIGAILLSSWPSAASVRDPAPRPSRRGANSPSPAAR